MGGASPGGGFTCKCFIPDGLLVFIKYIGWPGVVAQEAELSGALENRIRQGYERGRFGEVRRRRGETG